MNVLSPETVVREWEIWLYGRPGYRSPVAECGSFGSEGEACRVGAAVSLYLRLGVWSESVLGPVLDARPDAANERAWLRCLPDELRRAGVDPARVLVTARPTVAGDNQNAHADPFEDEDTVLEGDGPDVTYRVTDEDEAA